MAPKAVLIGLPGSGKSTIGRRLAKALGVDLVDTDAAIEARTGRRIAEIFAADGESGFRRTEEEVIRDALANHDGIVSLGGGAVTTPGVRSALVGHTVIYLEISAAEGIRRTSGSTVRPLLSGPDHADKYRELMRQRAPLYRRVATLRINTNRRNPGAVVRHIVGRLENPPQPGRRRPPWRRPVTTATTPTRDQSPTADRTPIPDRIEVPAVQGISPAPTPADSGPVTPATLARRAGARK